MNPLKAKLAAGQPILGIWSILPSPALVELVGQSGYDFQILDVEHGVWDLGTLENGIRAACAAGCSPLVRAPGPDAFFIQQALDLGAHGLIVPQVPDFAAAEAAVRMMHYAPEGTRGFNPFTRAGHYGIAERKAQSLQRNDFVFSSVIAESLSAFADLDRILEIERLDMVYLGVYDLSVALGCMGDTADPRLVAMVEDATRRIRAAGKAVGLLAKNGEEMRRFLDLGANCIVYCTDTWVIQKAMTEGAEAFRRARDNT